MDYLGVLANNTGGIIGGAATSFFDFGAGIADIAACAVPVEGFGCTPAKLAEGLITDWDGTTTALAHGLANDIGVLRSDLLSGDPYDSSHAFTGILIGAGTLASIKRLPTAGFKAAAPLADAPRLNPFKIRFTQNSVSPMFRDGRTIEQLADQLRSSGTLPDGLPPIRVFERNGQLFTLDNRRLVAFQKAGIDVPYVFAGAGELAAQSRKITTMNEGVSVTIRGGGGVWPP